jgi:hypothetical protein
MSSQSDYDAIVIGSGMGGLAFASIMAQVLEHYNSVHARLPVAGSGPPSRGQERQHSARHERQQRSN